MVEKVEKPPSSSPDSASLVKRLAGPSVTKAGLAKDQTEINRIIAEVSKGSKFYDNEKRKDKELTERIAKILKVKDSVMKEADIQGVEAEAHRLFVELEEERDLSQVIVHVDMDAFYANVELLTNPDLKDKPFGVGKGVLCTASYEARKYGVRSGMAGFVAKKLCPELILLPVDFQKYGQMSSKVMAIFRLYDPNMIVAGCDEGYMNITKYCQEHNLEPEECVRTMREHVKTETNLTVSAGIAPNKMLAKICSDKNKPNGQFRLSFEPEAIKAFMRDLSIRKLPGVGRVNERLLESIGVKTCGDIYNYRAVIWLMDHYFGKNFLFKAHLGIASNIVEPHRRDERKSIGAERTFNPISDQSKILEKLDEVAVELEKDMKELGWAGKTVTLKYKLDTYQVFTKAKSFDRWVTKKDDLFNTGRELIKPEFPLCIRLIGLRVTKLKDLRVSADQGIKRFLQSSSHEGSPTKKRRVNSLVGHGLPENDSGMTTDDAMPGFHEHELADQNQWENGDDINLSENTLVESEHAKLQESCDQSSSVKPSSTISNTTAQRQPSPEKHETKPLEVSVLQTCPICKRELDMDNVAINEHLDFCLSRQTIKQVASVSDGRRQQTLTLFNLKETGRSVKRKETRT